MFLTGKAKFVSRNTGTSKKGNPFNMVKFLDGEDDEFFTAFVEESIFRLFDEVKKGDEMSLTLKLVPGKSYFSLVDAEVLD